MDFEALMSMASSKQDKKDKVRVNRYSLDLQPAKREGKSFSHSEVVQKMLKEKENERDKERAKHKARKEAKLKEAELREAEERKKNQFRIPKKKPEAIADIADKESFINSLFDDSTISTKETENEDESPNDVSQSPPPPSSNKTSSSSSSKSHSSSATKSRDESVERKHGSSRSSSHTSSNHKSTSDAKELSKHSSKDSKDSKSSSSSSKSHSSSSSSHSKSNHQSPSSSSSHPRSKSSSSSSSSHSRSKSSSSSHSSSSKSKSRVPSPSSASSLSSKSSTSADKSSSLPSASSKSPSSSNERKPSDERPIVLSKHHLNPVAERQASNPYLTEKEQILARLKAIKERTLAAIHKESTSKGKRVRGERGSRKTKEEERDDPRIKSKEIVRDIVSSSEEEEVPEALDIMLNERNIKLEKEKIARMAKQAWQRAMKKDKGESDDEIKRAKERKKRKHLKTDRKENHSHANGSNHKNHGTSKRREHSLSPEPMPAKQKIVRHAGNAAPPPMDFQALLAMAEKKQKEAPKPEAVVEKKKKEKEKRPMTQEEKERHELIKSKEYKHWLKHGGKCPDRNKKDESDDDDDAPSRSKASGSSQQQTQSQNKASSSKTNPSAFGGKPSAYASYVARETSKIATSSKTFNGSASNANRKITVNENVLVCGSAEDSEEDSPSPRAKGVKDNPFDRLFNQVHKAKSRSKVPSGNSSSSSSDAKRKKIEDSEYEEEDNSELDDFIDDGDDGAMDYSREIKNIFGYDKSRYRHVDEDDSDMEADFSTIMKEETRSAKIGRMEDLEDMRKEEEELKRKALLKKKMKRRM